MIETAFVYFGATVGILLGFLFVTIPIFLMYLFITRCYEVYTAWQYNRTIDKVISDEQKESETESFIPAGVIDE